MFSTNSILFALVGCATVYLFLHRRRQLSNLTPEQFPELDEEHYHQLTILLKTAYERTLYMGVFFFPLAWAAREGGERFSQLFFLMLIALLFCSNIFPRNRIMKLLEENQLTMRLLRERGIHL